MSEAIVQIHDLQKRYGPVTAVAGVSFDVVGGEIFGILGPNGAGKTTTLEMIEGVRRPDRLGRGVLSRCCVALQVGITG